MNPEQRQLDSVRANEIRLIGLDIGSTTTSAMVAAARVLRNCVTGRMELGDLTALYRSEPVFTPFVDDELDERRLAEHFDRWIAESGVDPGDIASGGAIVTGLAAQKKNAAVVTALVRQRFGETLIATADDPGLESWLAFMGNTFGLSRVHPQVPFINLDIGGGTTNLAWGCDGEVRGVGCYFIGARHLRFTPGTYRIAGISAFAARMLVDLGTDKTIGDDLDEESRQSILNFYVAVLEAAVRGDAEFLCHEPVRRLEQITFCPPVGPRGAGFQPATDGQIGNLPHDLPVITLSGGVGELAYRHVRGEPLPGTTAYGDLGIDFARRLCESPLLAKDLRTYVPTNLGRATVYGLTIHNTELSGSTLHLPRPDLLPLSDLPIVGRIADPLDESAIRAVLELAQRGGRGACVQVDIAFDDAASVKSLGQRLNRALRETRFPPDRPLVLLVGKNVGKTLGQYATDWGRLPVDLITIDEIPGRNAHFASLGRVCHNLIPVSFYGMR